MVISSTAFKIKLDPTFESEHDITAYFMLGNGKMRTLF